MKSCDEPARIACPRCHRRLTLDPVTIRGKFQCPRCLHTVELQEDAVPDAPPASAADVAQLRAENERLRRELELAKAALEDTAHIAGALSDLEQRICRLGEMYVKHVSAATE